MGKGQKARREQDSMKAQDNLLAKPAPSSLSMLGGNRPPVVPAGFGKPTPAGTAVKKHSFPRMFGTESERVAFKNMDLAGRLALLETVIKIPRECVEASGIKSSRSLQSLQASMTSLNIMESNQQGGLRASKSSSTLESMAPSMDSSSKWNAGTVDDLLWILSSRGVVSPEGRRVLDAVVIIVHSRVSSSLESALQLLHSMISSIGSRLAEPLVVSVFSDILYLHTDRSAGVREVCAKILSDMAPALCPQAIYVLYPTLRTAMISDTSDWKVKVAGLEVLRAFASSCSKQVSALLPKIIPDVTECIIDPKKQVKTMGTEVLTIACKAITNEDILPIVPHLVGVIARPEDSTKTLDLLLETTFVANVDSSTLALIAPLLGKALRGRSSVLKRKAARVIDNMCRLVQEPRFVAPFVPLLLPALDRVIDEIADEEVCDVAKAAREVLLKAMGEGSVSSVNAGDSTAGAGGAADDVSVSDVMSDVASSVNESEEIYYATLLLQALEEAVPLPAAAESGGDASTVTPGAATEEEELRVSQAYLRDYISRMCALLVLRDTPAHPETLATNEAPIPSDQLWRYGVAMSSNAEWLACTAPYMTSLLSSSATEGSNADETAGAATATPEETAAVAFRAKALGEVKDFELDDDADGGNVCNIEFSLAFGGKILLHNTRLRLGRGRRYGLMGKNGAGKTTLLTNIGNGNIEGFPPEINTVYVQHDDASDDYGVSIVDELIAEAKKKAVETATAKAAAAAAALAASAASGSVAVEAGKEIDGEKKTSDERSSSEGQIGFTREDAVNALKGINFTDMMINSPRSALSGGWKMKLLIVKAMLARADVLLLDEPTNHLDAASVQWLVDYLNGQKHLTCLIVSHDTQFLDNVITDVIHYESRKLVYYKGSLSHFVDIHPEAKYYYELNSSSLKFVFPTPERLDGINSTTRAIMRMENVSFTYPNAPAPTIKNASVKLCLGSRVAVLGKNGAGKSTLIKMLVEETLPDGHDETSAKKDGEEGEGVEEGKGGKDKNASNSDGKGTIWKHHNLRVAYVAQHSFHHIEQHLDQSPVDYFKWRFAGGVDKESMNKKSVALTEEEELARKEGGMKKKYGDVDLILGRRKNGRSLEYECTWIGQSDREENKYYTLEAMLEMGLQKEVQATDTRIAAVAAGLDLRPLVTREIQGHLDLFNLEAEFGTHGKIRRLSGGQKVKLVLAAAMWNKPHVVILDEPTNYLDREALGALTQAIKDFGGGVAIISHNKEFTDAICTETWLVENGQVHTQGDVEETALKANSIRKVRAEKKTEEEKEKKQAEEKSVKGGGNTNATKGEVTMLKNPKTLEYLTKKEIRRLEKSANVAGISLKEYVGKLNKNSPEWKWLSNKND